MSYSNAYLTELILLVLFVQGIIALNIHKQAWPNITQNILSNLTQKHAFSSEECQKLKDAQGDVNKSRKFSKDALSQVKTHKLQCKATNELLVHNEISVGQINRVQLLSSKANNCRLSILAQAGHQIELVWTQFNVGNLIHINGSATCRDEYMQVFDSANANNLPTSEEEEQFKLGVYCGKLKQEVSYLSRNTNLTLDLFSTPNHEPIILVEFIYRIVNHRSSILDRTLGFPVSNSNCDHIFENCLHPAKCIIRSPDYPRLLARNLTCKYLILQNQNFLNYRFDSRIELSQENEADLNIPPILPPNSLSQESSFKCNGDVLTVYDGPIAIENKKLFTICGYGKIPPIRSTSIQLLVVLNTQPYAELKPGHFQLQVCTQQTPKIQYTKNHKYYHYNYENLNSFQNQTNNFLPPFLPIPQSYTSESKSSSCDEFYNASTTSQRQGQIIFHNQMQNQARNAACIIHLSSSNPFDKIWFYFTSFRPANLLNHGLNSLPISGLNECKINELKIYELSHLDTYASSKPLFRFCETKMPHICSTKNKPSNSQLNANDFYNKNNLLNENQQLNFCYQTNESYLSNTPRLQLIALNHVAPSLYLLPMQFTLNYEFVNTQEYGEAVSGSSCDRLFDSTKFKHGTVRSTRNLFFYGRGGRPNLRCAYIFRGAPGQRLRIQLYRIKVKSNNCFQARDANTGITTCYYQSKSVLHQAQQTQEKSSMFSVWDSVESGAQSSSPSNPYLKSNNQIYLPISCFCNKTVNFLTPISYHLTGSIVTLNFTVKNMLPTEDFNDFAFEAFYEFLPASNEAIIQTPPFIELAYARNFYLNLDKNSIVSSALNYTVRTFAITVPSNFSFDYYQEFKQSKRLLASASTDKVLLSVAGAFLWKSSTLRTCSQLSRFIIYWIQSPTTSKAIATLCVEPYRVSLGPTSNSSKVTYSILSTPIEPDSIQFSFDLGYASVHSAQDNLNQNSKTLHFYANHTVKNIDLVIELIATNKGNYRFDWLVHNVQKNIFTHNSSSISSAKTEQHINHFSEKNKQTSKQAISDWNAKNKINCVTFCPESSALCLQLDQLCDQISHCSTSGWDESPLLCEAKEHNRLEAYLNQLKAEQKLIDSTGEISSSKHAIWLNWFYSLAFALITICIIIIFFVIISLRRKNQREKQRTINESYATTLAIESSSSSCSGSSSSGNNCSHMFNCNKRLSKVKRKMFRDQKRNTLNDNQLTINNTDGFNPLINTFSTNINTNIGQNIHHGHIADYSSTQEFQFEMNPERLSQYERQNSGQLILNTGQMTPIYKNIDENEYSLKRQHIYYQPSYMSLQRSTCINLNIDQCMQQQDATNQLTKNNTPPSLPTSSPPPLPPFSQARDQFFFNQHPTLASNQLTKLRSLNSNSFNNNSSNRPSNLHTLHRNLQTLPTYEENSFNHDTVYGTNYDKLQTMQPSTYELARGSNKCNMNTISAMHRNGPFLHTTTGQIRRLN